VSNNADTIAGAVVGVGGILALVFFAGIGVGKHFGVKEAEQSEHKVALDAKVGYWQANPETGVPEFHYGTKPEEKPK